MTVRSFSMAIAIGIAAVWWRLAVLGAAARCSYMAMYPSAIGRHTFLLASATPGSVMASVETPDFFRQRTVPAQVMRIKKVAGFEADVVRGGLRASGGTAVFIRYGYGPSCAPFPELDGAFDSTGVNGLYVGRPRAPARAARKQPAGQVTSEMLSEITNATTAANPIPFGGTFAISVVVPGVDSLVMYGQTSIRARPWIVDLTRDSLTGVPVAIRPRSFAIDVTTARTEAALVRHQGPNNPCAPIPIVVDALPIVPDADSTWSGTMLASRFLDCAPPGSVLARLKGDEKTTTVALGSTRVTFRRQPDGRITFDARTIEDGKANVFVHGERVSN